MGGDGVSNHQPHDWLLNHLFVTGLCEGNSSLTGEFPAQRASNTESVSIWWRHQNHVSPPVFIDVINLKVLLLYICEISVWGELQG